jgi:hypothetical protein
MEPVAVEARLDASRSLPNILVSCQLPRRTNVWGSTAAFTETDRRMRPVVAIRRLPHGDPKHARVPAGHPGEYRVGVRSGVQFCCGAQ